MINPFSEKYRVLLFGIGRNTEEEKELFCHRLSEKFSIPRPLLKRIIDHCPIVLKENLSRKMAEFLAKTLKSFGAQISLEVKRDVPPSFLEFQNLGPHHLALESSSFGRTQSGLWNVVGRVRNITSQPLTDVWVLIQLFDDHEEFLTFEEVPLILNPLPTEEISPFKAVFEKDLTAHKISIGFKTSSGTPLAALDRRPVPQWTKVEWDDGDEAVLSINLSKPRRPIDVEKPKEELKIEISVHPREDPQPSKEEPDYGGRTPSAETKANLHGNHEEAALTRDEPPLDNTDLPHYDRSIPVEEGPSIPFEAEIGGISSEPENIETSTEPTPCPLLSIPSLKKWENSTAIGAKSEEATEGKNAPESPAIAGERPHLDASTFEEASRLVNEISEKTETRGKESSSFHWLDEFKNAVERYYQEHPDSFLQWIMARQSENEFSDDSHSLLTILAHARFDQMNETEKALKNTERVFQLLTKPQIALEEIPTLEGTLFFSPEQWRDLFYRAVPKLQQIGRSILDKKRGKAHEIQRMILVIPHMSEKMSRKATRWISELMPQAMTIDFSDHPALIDRPLYRVASRLGIIDPHFDFYQGRDSMGDLKLQSFAKGVFPLDPSKIEAPMVWIGGDEAAGHCLPTQPRCEGCPFEKFCQKLYPHFDPSEKGMGHH